MNMLQEGGDQRRDFHLSPPRPQCSALLSRVIKRLVGSPEKLYLRPPSIGFMMNAFDSPTTSEQQVMNFLSSNLIAIQDRIKSAMRHSEIYYQFWAPVTVAEQTYLTTFRQPFFYNFHDKEFYKYRQISSDRFYRIDIREEDELGPPGRVFLQGFPEFSPNVMYYSTKEYSLRNCALHFGLKKYSALPIFESCGGRLVCVGVLELFPHSEDGIRNTSMVAVAAIKAVGLISSSMYFQKCKDIYADGCKTRRYSKKLLDILCKEYSLPFARAWVLCGCQYPEYHSRWTDEALLVEKEDDSENIFSLRVEDDDDNWDDSEEIYSFRANCTFLQEGQGLVGKAYEHARSCFCKDVTQLSMTDYPFVHLARACGLTSCFAVYLPSIDFRLDIYILELFLAPGGVYNGDPRALLESILATMAPHLHNFKFMFRPHLEERVLQVHLFQSEGNVDYFEISQRETLNVVETSQKRKDQQLEINSTKGEENINTSHIQEEEIEGSVAISKKENRIESDEEREVSVTNSKKENRIESGGVRIDVGDEITYELVKPHFGRNLQDVADSFGTSRTTFKRRLRDIGIKRWPSHQRKNLLPAKSNAFPKKDRSVSNVDVVSKKGKSTADPAMQEDKNTMIIKATYGDHIIKFPVSFLSRFEDLKREVEKRLKLQNYIIKYKDEEGDWILMTCNDDLHYSMQSKKASGSTSVQLLLVEN